MRRARLLVLAPLTLWLSGCMGTIPIVGLDEEGKVIQEMIKERKYVQRLSSSVTDLQESVIPALDSQEGRYLSGLRETQLGLGLKGSAGLGDYFKLGGNIGFRLVFANQ